MENKLMVKENVQVLDSREVAEMMGKAHKELMRDIRGGGKNKGLMPILTGGNYSLVDFFIESTYVDAKGEIRNCFLITKMGCELLGNKLQGEKGVLFTANYVTKFNAMEKVIESALMSFQIADPIARAEKFIEEQKEMNRLMTEKNEIIEELSPLAELARKRIDNTGTISITDATKTFGLKVGQITVWAKTNGLIHKTLREVNKKGDEYFKVVCVDGEHKSVAIKEEGLKLIDKNLEEIKQSPCRFKAC